MNLPYKEDDKHLLQKENLYFAVFFISLDCFENGDPPPFSEREKEPDEYIVSCIREAQDAGISEDDIKNIVTRANEQAFEQFMTRVLFEAKREKMLEKEGFK